MSEKELTRTLLKRLPKVELHRHLDGSVRPSTLLELAREQQIELPTQDLEELTKLVTVDNDCESLVDYLRCFEITLKVLQKGYAITRVMYEVCEDAVRDGIRYMEVRFSPILHVDNGLSLSAVMEAICEGAAMAQYRLPINAKIIVCGLRHMSSDVTHKLAEIAWRYRHKGVGGFDLAGPESGFSSKHHKLAFDMIRNKLLYCTLHAGEAAGHASIADAIQFCGAHRIGHGVRLVDSPELLQYVVDRRIAVEVCPTSNLQTGAIEKLEDHPIRKFYDAGVNIVICCDNCTVSKVSLTGEYYRCHKLFDFKVHEILRLIDNGYNAAFLTSVERQRLRAEALYTSLSILKSEGYDITGVLEDKHYWLGIGVDVERFCSQSIQEIHESNAFWGNYYNPEITLDVIKSLPKTDVHCYLVGSVSLELVWQEIQDAGIVLHEEFFCGRCSTFESFKKVFCGEDHAENVEFLAKQIMTRVLQLPGQLKRGVKDVLQTAAEDNVKYMELVLRPKSHTDDGLTVDEVLEIVLGEVEKQSEKLDITVGVVVYVNNLTDDALHWYETAKLAVKFRKRGVVGYGVFGKDFESRLAFSYMSSTFNFLKKNLMNVCVFAGESSFQAILGALHEGGAARLSGAFQIHKGPRLMNYLANMHIPVELGLTKRYRQATRDVRQFVYSAVRLYLDHEVPVTICSFRSQQPFQCMTRSEVLLNIIKEAKFSISEVLRLLGNGFKYNFQNYKKRMEMYTKFRADAEQSLNEKKFSYFYRLNYFPAISTEEFGKLSNSSASASSASSAFLT